jgi:hypothetical protein
MLEVSEDFLLEVGYSDPDDLLQPLFDASPQGVVFSQRTDGQPFRIDHIADRRGGNNIFFVPAERLADFYGASGRAF